MSPRSVAFLRFASPKPSQLLWTWRPLSRHPRELHLFLASSSNSVLLNPVGLSKSALAATIWRECCSGRRCHGRWET
ncbi:hypothetical protein N658DRAFT_327678 [Parathielavia hyrcaniae]|uniref:Uncharacterized protein n=1 Tax=Parathielavia hyrcaniae TaxID=113614 RepID=A0AAN6T3P6_9PEZI|nr:hypothetical protein N658DRAFT_327678 [Parathielavia hyrcaniae]